MTKDASTTLSMTAIPLRNPAFCDELPKARNLPLAGTAVHLYFSAVSISVHFWAAKNEPKSCPLIAAYILVKAGNRAQNRVCFAYIPFSTFCSAQL